MIAVREQVLGFVDEVIGQVGDFFDYSKSTQGGLVEFQRKDAVDSFQDVVISGAPSSECRYCLSPAVSQFR